MTDNSRSFWQAVTGSSMAIGKLRATGFGVFCLTVIVIVVVIIRS